MKPSLLCLLVLGYLTLPARGAEPAVLKIHLLGAGEYKPVESLTGYQKYLEEKFRVRCTTSFGNDGKSLPNLEQLKTADVMVVFLRRMNLPAEQMAIIRNHWEQGKPIVAMRTASHAFQPDDNAIFDRQVLGGNYRGSGSYTTPFKAIALPAKSEHPVLKGVGAITSKGYYGNDKLADDAEVLQVVESDKKTPLPVTWAHTYQGGRTIYTSLGVPEDFQDENFRRLLSNAIFWTAERDPAQMQK
ncbi:Trehalose utilization [Anatilimnocola aggregata]|uniref:Trehalose utilization n=1 Tax=Anatilimnocola aggregata TaxID=2528021 RepID=A0A517Y8E7_9BACT|nr:ThuA domain-containing protein [Anatilimnocola aggregata]QDU26493.1 Trehalose utilization [Anatilimnocola aggregata]